MGISSATLERRGIVRRGLWLAGLTLGYNSLEAIISLTAGIRAGSEALVAFGGDSVIELVAGTAALWRLFADVDQERRARVERIVLRIVGWSFVALAVYIAFEASTTLFRREQPDASMVGIVLAAASLLLMPVLSRAKRGVAHSLGSHSLDREAEQTAICAWMSAIVLGGLLLNAAAGWWWADPVAALVLAPIVFREGTAALGGRHCADGCT